MKKSIIGTILCAGLCIGGGSKGLNEYNAQAFTPLKQASSTEKTRNDIFFTIDDGPSKYTLDIAKTLDSLGYKGIFFLVGEGITKKNRGQLIEVLKMGHTLGNHSYSHPNFAKLDLARAEKEIIGTDTLLSSLMEEAGVHKQKYLRYPYGVQIHKEYRDDFQSFLDSLGYGKPMHRHMDIGLRDRSHEAYPKNIASIKPGDTVVIHERPRAVDEIKKIVASLKERETNNILSNK